jgi:ATP-binding cassette, subfamily B, bacterial
MNYDLNAKVTEGTKRQSSFRSLKSLISHMVMEKSTLLIALAAVVVSAVLSLLGPTLIGYTIDHYVQTKIMSGVLLFSGIILVMYIVSMIAGYIQAKLMGTVGQRMLYTLRNSVFSKIQALPLDFFNQNKAGDLISRINNDTDKINQFFSQSLMQFVRSILIMTGAGIFLLSLNTPLGAAALSPGIAIWVFTALVSPWVKRKNAANLIKTGGLSSEIQESLNNFKVIIAFNRRDYFRHKFNNANTDNYNAAIKSGIANNLFMPVYTLFANIGEMIVLTYGIYLISKGRFTLGFLVTFIAYINNFYGPLRQLAALWASFQVALAAWDRILRILNMETNLPVTTPSVIEDKGNLLSFRDVSFKYPNGTEVLHRITFDLGRGKTYAFVGPTGGGKTTTASLIARLYDPTKGMVLLEGRDIRSFDPKERVKKIGFILQDPFLFSGTLRDNILYGNEEYSGLENGEIIEVLRTTALEALLDRFDKGLESVIDTSGESMSLGQKQLIAFMRAVLRKPELIILDEATANIDTVTEKQLDDILQKLPDSTTKVIIAHRLNTIANADVIYFVNSGMVTRAGSLDEAVAMLMKGRRTA